MLDVKNLQKSYTIGKKSYPVLKGVDLSVAKGEFVAVMGPSGSGRARFSTVSPATFLLRRAKLLWEAKN